MSLMDRLDGRSEIVPGEPTHGTRSPSVDAVACPYLGLAGDPRTRFSFPAAAHRCHAGSKPATIDPARQGAYCLSGQYPTCDRYRPPKEAGKATVDPRLSVEAASAAEALAEAATRSDPSSPASEPQAEPVKARTFTFEPVTARHASSEERPTEIVPAAAALSAASSEVASVGSATVETGLSVEVEPSPDASQADPDRIDEVPTVRARDPQPSPPKVAKSKRAPVGVLPSQAIPAAATPSKGTDVGTQPLALEWVAAVPREPFQPTAPPPTAWRTATTASTLASILPPIEVPIEPAATELTPSTAPNTTFVADMAAVAAMPVPEQALPVMVAAPTVAATPVAPTRARLPASAPLTASTVAFGPWTEMTEDRKQGRGRRRVLLLLVLLALAAVATAVFFAAASGSLDRLLPTSLVHSMIAAATSAAERSAQALISPPRM